MRKITQPLQICIGPSIRIGRESWCLPYAGFFSSEIAKHPKICPSFGGKMPEAQFRHAHLTT